MGASSGMGAVWMLRNAYTVTRQLLLQRVRADGSLEQIRRMRAGDSKKIIMPAVNTVHFSSACPQAGSAKRFLCLNQLLVFNG